MNERAITSDNMGKMGFYIAVTGRMMRAMAFWGEDVGIPVTAYDEEPGPVKEDILERDYVV